MDYITLLRKLKPISIRQLAKLYFPRSTPHSAVTQFRRTIVRCKPLHEELTRLGYRPHQRVLTWEQYQAVIAQLCEP